jgi:hypothetical protein
MGIRGWRKLCKERMEWKRITEWVVTSVKEEEKERILLPLFDYENATVYTIERYSQIEELQQIREK